MDVLSNDVTNEKSNNVDKAKMQSDKSRIVRLMTQERRL